MAASTSGSGGGHRNQAVWPAYMARYEPLARLGAGMNGEVFKAWDTKENRVVAVKRLSRTGIDAGDDLIFSGLQEVWRECRCLRTCDGIPSVVKLLDKVVPKVNSDYSFLIMEYAGRLNLRGYMQRRAHRHRRFSEAEVCRIMKELLEGVNSVHGTGVMHLDIRPENVILDDGTEDRTERRPKNKKGAIQDGQLKEDDIVYKIGGFGISRKKERSPKQPEVTIATAYSAPELLLHSCEYDEHADTWGLGCIMADLLSGTGMPTFGPDDSEEKIMSKVFRVVDPKCKKINDWAGYSRIAAEWKSKLPGKNKSKLPRIAAGLKTKILGDPLRRRFPLWRLSSAGFEVLSGLLESNPAKRLTAAEALEKPWFHQDRR
ncbi:putative cyclin-dependent kinase F-2 [Lolium rigidum]|uniref:putative cyclin-dependent kinase F-2 n=1 Tax=Lolium rigidum TaxID=89674 RepID=UPI001F5D3435|nr:putative cyclin-dependent kinase F-2 [Lolium rigidum]